MDSGGFGKAQKPPKVAKVTPLILFFTCNSVLNFGWLGEKQNTGRNSNHRRTVASGS